MNEHSIDLARMNAFHQARVAAVGLAVGWVPQDDAYLESFFERMDKELNIRLRALPSNHVEASVLLLEHAENYITDAVIFRASHYGAAEGRSFEYFLRKTLEVAVAQAKESTNV